MTRATLVTDRAVGAVVGLVLVVAGVVAAVWGTGAVSWLSGRIDLAGLDTATGTDWWPWALGVGGTLAVLLALRWLLAHLPRRGAGPVLLPGSSREGRLTADGGAVTSAAAEALAQGMGFRSADGTLVRDRGQVTSRFTATIAPEADLRTVLEHADAVSADLRRALGRDDLYCQVRLRVGGATGRRDRGPRVR